MSVEPGKTPLVSELVRFLVAQVLTLFLTLGGLGLEWMVLRSLTR